MKRYIGEGPKGKSFSLCVAWGPAGWPVELFCFPNMEALVVLRRLHYLAMNY